MDHVLMMNALEKNPNKLSPQYLYEGKNFIRLSSFDIMHISNVGFIMDTPSTNNTKILPIITPKRWHIKRIRKIRKGMENHK